MASTMPAVRPGTPWRPPPPRIVEVRRVVRLTPRMVRITFGGGQIEGFESSGPAEHLRVFLPDSRTGRLLLPEMGPEGNVFPANKPRPDSRAYTPRRWDPVKGELDIDVALHDHGPGAVWAATVRPGDTAVISGRAGGAYFPDLDVDWYVIGGDETALPAIATVVEALPSSMLALVFIEVHDEEEEQALESPAAMHVQWLHRRAGAMPGRMLADAVCGAALPQGHGRIWVSCEATVMREIRRHFLEERGLPRSMLRTQGYWKAGTINHPDHDMGDDQ